MENGNEKRALFRVRTCATSANMGPGFDAAALALDIYDECEVFAGTGRDHIIRHRGPYSSHIDSKKSLVIYALKEAGKKYAGRVAHAGKSSLDIYMTVNIPPGKGLGSSASAVISGLLIANKAYRLGLNKKELFQAASEIESSPDNAAAALSGGMAVIYRDGGQYLFEKIGLEKGYRIMLFIPFGTASTEEARKLIPKKVPIQDAVGNISNFSLFLKCLEEGRLEEASVFCQDYMYLKYRKAMYPTSLGLVNELVETYKVPAFVSGAGPAVAAIMDKETFAGFKDIKGRVMAQYLSFQSMVTGISSGGSYYL